MNYKFAVLVLVYNPDMRKLLSTIKSILHQKNIEYSVVIADDGSKEIDWIAIENIFEEYNFNKYSIVKNPVNLGTVKNLYSGLIHINSEFVFTISPGDILFDENTLFDLYEYCSKQENNSFFFGNAIYYQNSRGSITINETLFPNLPHVYNKTLPWTISSTAYFSRQHICGASYFYRTLPFKQYIEEIIDIGIKYVEDYTTAALYILDGNQIVFIDRNTIWYESNTGVSGSRNEEWDRILNNDINCLAGYLKKKYVKNPIVETKFGGFIDRIKHPVISVIAITIIILSKIKKNIPSINENDKNRLIKFISG